MRVIRTFLMGAVLLAAACGGSSSASNMKVKTSGADVAAAQQFSTYSHETAEEAPKGYRGNPIQSVELLDKVRADIDDEMQKRGYMRVDNGGQLVVRVSSGTRQVLDEPTGSAARAGVPEKEETEGALVIDIFESGSQKPFFHGYARDVIKDNAVTDAQIAKAVATILAKVPPSAQ